MKPKYDNNTKSTLIAYIFQLENSLSISSKRMFKLEKKIHNLEEENLFLKKLILSAYEESKEVLANKAENKSLRLSLLGAIIYRTYFNVFRDDKDLNISKD